jgi:ubiquinone/menaquinone biosynthesis C-methylase UbiE
MQAYYSQKLSADHLRRCYEIAPLRVKRYLEAEIEFVLDKMKPADLALELGCGYGRALQKLAAKAKIMVGIDTSYASLRLAAETICGTPSCQLFVMNAVKLGFRDRQFDVVVCIQNGIAVFNEDQRDLIEEAVRVTRSGGKVLFSSYSERFWKDRLEWFRIQSQHGLIGEIDEEATRDGVIICKDGFKASTVSPDDFISLTSDFEINPILTEVDGSSLFCEIRIE